MHSAMLELVITYNYWCIRENAHMSTRIPHGSFLAWLRGKCAKYLKYKRFSRFPMVPGKSA